MFIFASRLDVCVSVCVFIAFACVCDLARSCACVFFSTCACVRLSVRVGLLCSGFLPVERSRDVRVGASSQHPLLQEEVPGVGQVCGAALSPGCQRVLLTHGSAAPAALEQLSHRCAWTSFLYFVFNSKSMSH